MEWSIVSMGSNPEAMNAKRPRWKKLKSNFKNKTGGNRRSEKRNRAIRAAQLINNQNKYKK
jgi:hypothetical protein